MVYAKIFQRCGGLSNKHKTKQYLKGLRLNVGPQSAQQ